MVSNISHSKIAQADIVSTILLVLLTIVATVILMSFVIPFVKNQISKTECFDFNGKIEIKNSDFTCYDSATKKLTIQIGVNDVDKKKIDLLTGLRITVMNNGSSESFEVNSSNVNPRIVMYNGASTLLVPKNNEEKTYNITNINSKPSSISVYPILSGTKSCSDAINQVNEVDDC
ncbi:Uncharacterised protein [uncultured archaeon]|nr:Uncharacterised protein [uncultured archaeon]